MSVPSYEKLFKPVENCLTLVGIPFEDNPETTIRFLVLCVWISITIIAEFAFFVTKISSENFLELTALAPCLGTGLLSLLKILFIYFKRKTVMNLIKRLHYLYLQIKNEPESLNLVKDDINFVKTLTVSYVILNQVLVWVYNLASIVIMAYVYIVDEKVVFKLPFAVTFPFAIDTWPIWAVMYVHSIVSGFLAIVYISAVDGLYCILTSLVCANFSTLSNKIQKLNFDNKNWLLKLVHNHQYLLELAGQLEDIFTGPNLLNVLVGSLEICALGFNLTTGDWTQIPGSLLFIVSVLLQILMMSMFGEYLMRQSEQIGQAAYLCNWMNLDRDSKKMLILMHERARRPQVLTAYKFSVISYQSFTRIIGTSWSYFTILKTVYKPTETANISAP